MMKKKFLFLQNSPELSADQGSPVHAGSVLVSPLWGEHAARNIQ